MATMTRVYLQLRDLTGGTFDGPENTVVQVSWPVPRVTDEAVPEVLVMRTVQGTIDATGTLVDATLAEGLEVLDPNDATVTPHGYTLTITVMPQDGRPAWIAYAVLDTPRTGGGYDLAANMTVPDADGRQWFKGDTGPAGQGIAIKGHVMSSAALPATGNEPGDAYIADDTGNLWVWTGTAWSDVGPFQGPTGTAATITIDPASGGVAHGTPTSVTNTGTTSAAKLKILVEEAADGVDGKSLEFAWSTDKLGVRQQGSATYTYSPSLTGPAGGATVLSDLSDVDTTGAADKTVLTYSTSTSKWTPAAISGGPIHGHGFPEGVVTAPPGTEYIDDDVTNGALKWAKMSGTGNTGWKVTFGDTGWRKVAYDVPPDPDTNSFIQIRIRRIGDFVYVRARALTDARTYTLPTGFKESLNWSTDGQNMMYSIGTVTLDRTNGANKITVASGSGGQLTVITADTWPSTLPGSAA